MQKLIHILYGEYLKDFDLEDANYYPHGEDDQEIRIVFREKATKAPRSGLVKNGYLKKIELIDAPTAGHPVYLHFYRRRWQDSQTKQSFYNEYDFAITGTKLTHRFGNFLKEKDRKEVGEFLDVFPLLQSEVKTALPLLQDSRRFLQGIFTKRASSA